jgi:hypothetical protein
MPNFRKKFNSLKKIFTKSGPKYKRFYNHEPNHGLPKQSETYKKYDQPEPPQIGKGRRKRSGKRKRRRSRKLSIKRR